MEFARVDYQESVATDADLPDRTADRLRVAPFPAYPRPDYADREAYGATKVVPVGGRICVSWVTYRGHADRDGRPLLTADLALLTTDEFAAAGRDVALVRDYLRRAGTDATPGGFEDYRDSTGDLSDESVFRDACGRFDRELLADGVATVLDGGRTVVDHEDRDRGEAFLRLAWGILPLAVVAETSFCTDCQHPGRDGAEDVVLSTGTSGGGSGVFGGSTGTEADVDLATGDAPGGPRSSLVRAVLDELLATDGWYGFTWSERRSLLLDHLAGGHAGDGQSLVDRSDRLRAMEATLDRIRAVDESGDGSEGGGRGWLP